MRCAPLETVSGSSATVARKSREAFCTPPLAPCRGRTLGPEVLGHRPYAGKTADSPIIAAVAELTRELLRQQDALQAEATAVELDLKVHDLLGSVGQVVRVGSAALGLMVWRDLDLTVVCTQLAIEP